MAIDSIGPGVGTISSIRNTLATLQGVTGVNRINPSEGEPPTDDVRVSSAAITDPRAVEQQELEALRQGLDEARAAGNVALAGAQAVAGTLEQIGGRIDQLADGTLDAERRSALEAEIRDLVGQGLDAIDDARAGGVNLIDAEQDQDLTVAADREGGTETIRDQDLRSVLEGLQGLSFASAADAAAVRDGTFADARAAAGAAIGALSEDTGRIAERIAAVQEQQAAALGGTPPPDAQAALQLATQVQQGLAGQQAGIVNARPEALVGLFR